MFILGPVIFFLLGAAVALFSYHFGRNNRNPAAGLTDNIRIPLLSRPIPDNGNRPNVPETPRPRGAV